MYDADLIGGLGEHSPDSFGEAFEIVGSRDQNVLDSPGLQVGQHAQLKGSGFALAQPEFQTFFFTVSHQAYGQVDRLFDDFGVFPDFE